jgi:hypothetical protein
MWRAVERFVLRIREVLSSNVCQETVNSDYDMRACSHCANTA